MSLRSPAGTLVDLDADDDGFDVVRPEDTTPNTPEGERGWRLHVFRRSYENTYIAEEQVWPEQVANVEANRVRKSNRLYITTTEVRWLHEQLGKIIAIADAEQATMDAQPAAAPCVCGHAKGVHHESIGCGTRTVSATGVVDCDCAAYVSSTAEGFAEAPRG